MFEESPNTRRILWFGSRRIGQLKAPIILAKVLAIHSAESPFPRLSLFDEARSREFKSVTSQLAMSMFPEDFYIDLSGDVTIHGLKEDYGENLHGKCLMVDDGNLLFRAMHPRSRSRWLSAIAQLYSRGRYDFSVRQERFELRGNISFVINITPDLWESNKEQIYGTTIGDRALILHSWLQRKQAFECKKRFETTEGMKSPVFIKERYPAKIRNLREYEGQLKVYAEQYSILAERSVLECYDLVIAIVSENARINKRDYICEDDIKVLELLQPYNKYPLAKESQKILLELKRGRRPIDICHILGWEPERGLPKISYWKKKFIKQGVLDISET